MEFRNTPDLESLYAGYIDAVNEENRKTRYEGKEEYFQGSSAGLCSRKHYFSVTKVPSLSMITIYGTDQLSGPIKNS